MEEQECLYPGGQSTLEEYMMKRIQFQTKWQRNKVRSSADTLMQCTLGLRQKTLRIRRGCSLAKCCDCVILAPELAELKTFSSSTGEV